MIGFLMQTDLGERGKIAPQPIYRLRTGEYLTAGGAHIDRLAGPVRVRPSQVGAPKPSTQTLSRGGFGRSARGYGG